MESRGIGKPTSHPLGGSNIHNHFHSSVGKEASISGTLSNSFFMFRNTTFKDCASGKKIMKTTDSGISKKVTWQKEQKEQVDPNTDIKAVNLVKFEDVIKEVLKVEPVGS